MQKIEVNRRRTLIGMEIGKGTCNNDVLLTMNKDCKDKGHDWIRENYGVNFNFEADKTCESTMHMMKDKCMETEKEVKYHVINELKKKDRKMCGLKKVIMKVKAVMKMITKETDQC